MIKLIGILIVVVGLALKQNPVATVFVSGIVTGLVVNMPVTEILESIGTTFVANRTMLVFLLTLPAIGLLERHGLKEYSAKPVSYTHLDVYKRQHSDLVHMACYHNPRLT